MKSLLIATTGPHLEPYIHADKIPLLNALITITGADTSFSRIPEMASDGIFKGAIKSPIPSTLDIRSWDEVCDLQGVELLKISETSPVTISWSGGIDSTVIVVSLLKNGYSPNKHDVRIFCTGESVKEYPSFFYYHILPNFEVSLRGVDKVIGAGNEYFVTGEPGDQLFGSALCLEMMRTHGDDVSQKGYEYIHSSLAYRYGAQGGLFWRHYRDIVKYAPFEIKTVEQFWWWWNFSQKWNQVLYRALVVCPDLSGADKLRCFFDTDLFQAWSINNAANGSLSMSRDSHKIAAKKYVVGYTQEDQYLLKAKYPSLAQRRRVNAWHLAIAEDYSVVNPSEFLNDSWKA